MEFNTTDCGCGHGKGMVPATTVCREANHVFGWVERVDRELFFFFLVLDRIRLALLHYLDNTLLYLSNAVRLVAVSFPARCTPHAVMGMGEVP